MKLAAAAALALVTSALFSSAIVSSAPMRVTGDGVISPRSLGGPPPGVVMLPEGNALNADLAVPSANLWLCEVGPCAGPGEGSLRVVQRASNITGEIGAYNLVVKYDPAVFTGVNPCDIAFGASGEGSGRGLVDEVSNPVLNADCSDDGGPGANGTCAISRLQEALNRFACVTAGQGAGPSGDFDLASLELTLNPSLKAVLSPSSGNGVTTTIAIFACKLVGTLGDGPPGTRNGFPSICGDLSVTVRVLEGDLDLDCDVDAADAQNIANRIGSGYGDAAYGRWYDLEPSFGDLDIDIKDVQKVFGRLGSTCQSPLPAQPPAFPPIPLY